MGWVIALLALIAVVLLIGFGLLIWVVDLGLAQVRQEIRLLRTESRKPSDF